jgi:hypothetical protein
MVVSMNEVLRQLTVSGKAKHLTNIEESGRAVYGIGCERLIRALRKDERFIEGIGHLLHDDVGGQRCDFRAIRGSFGKGSLQIVVSCETWRCYADLDGFSPYDDVVGFVAHWVGEVIPAWLRRKRKTEDTKDV